MNVLGINDGHLATAALLKDGTIIACVSEERFTRIKNQAGIPTQSIKFCLAKGGIDISQIDLVVFGGKLLPPTTHKTKMPKSIYTNLYSFSKPLLTAARFMSIKVSFIRTVEEIIYPLISSLLAPLVQNQRKSRFLKAFPSYKKTIIFIDHHLSHAYAVLFSSGLAQSKSPLLIFTCDGEGDSLSATVNIYENGELQKISKTPLSSSLGNLYRSITAYLGMKPLEHEYKVMGLAAYASEGDKKAQELFQKFTNLVTLNPKTLEIKTKVNSQLFKLGYFDSILKGYRFDHIAFATQKLTEKVLTEWVLAGINKTQIGNVLLSGGVFMNVKANQKIAELKEVKKIFVMPSGGDESNAIGAAYWGYYQKTKKVPKSLKSLYLGPSYSDTQVSKVIKDARRKNNWKVSVPKKMATTVARLLAKGQIVARAVGSMEWGARALGNRSILADPTYPEVVEIINKMIKSRDFWMPFAPVIMKAHHKKYVVNSKNIKAPFMIMTFETTDIGKRDLAAAIHRYDKTARPQIIDKKTNPDYYEILSEFSKRTKRYGLLNTSFNLHGFPIVCSPKDALETFANSGLKYLMLGKFLIEKVSNE